MATGVNKTCIVVGASHAGCHLAESARKHGWAGRIVVIGDEPYLPYHRPPLSKDFLAGEKSIERILIKPGSLYEKLGIEFMLETAVESIDRAKKRVHVRGGDTIDYDKLALATGARPRELPLPGSDLRGVHYLRSINDILSIKEHLVPGNHAVILGGGYIGLETAAALRGISVEVTILEVMPRILQRVTAPVVSAFYDRVHREEGVEIETNIAVTELTGDDSVSCVRCKDDKTYLADLVIIGAGIIPNSELALDCGLKVKNGVVVNEYAVTSDPDIVAAGDCAWHFNPIYNRWMRLESVQNAHDQARVAGAAVCGADKKYAELPWFWSDQFGMKLQIAGLSQGFDDVIIRGSTETGRQFAAFYFKGPKLLAVDAVNMPLAFMIGKKLLVSDIKVDKSTISDMEYNLKQLVR